MKRLVVILVSFLMLIIAAVALSSCRATYTPRYEQPYVGGVPITRGDCDATIKVGRKTAIIKENGTIREVVADSVKMDGGIITIGYTERIKVLYYGLATGN